MVFRSEFRHYSNARFVGDDDDDINNEGEFEIIVNENEVFTEASESELFDRKVKSNEEAYELYNSYAFKHSFGIRKEKKPGEEPKVYQKRNFRTGCKAHIQFDVDKNSGLFIVVNHIMDHNHSRVPISKRHLIRSHRKVSEEQIAMLSSLTESSIPIADAVRVLKHQAGGEANLSFLCRDAYGALSAHKKMKFDGCDAMQLLSYFKGSKCNEYDFYYDFDVDEKGHLESFFFRDNRMKVDYDAFGDLLVHDTTYRSNKYDTIQEFEHYWSSMLNKYKCTDNKWLQNLYNIREMLCPAYSKDYFSGGVISSQRSETTNKSVSRRLHATHGLCDFYTSFIEVVDEWRSKEGSNDYDSLTGNRHLVWAYIGILEHTRRISTIQIYIHFEDNFVSGVPCTAKVIGMQPPLYEYHMGHPKKDLLMHTVAFDESTVTVDCTCKYFGEVGLLCKHLLRVLHLNNVTYIPKRYICKRWTKSAMCTWVDDNVVVVKGVTPSSVWTLHFIRTFIGLVDWAQNDLGARTVIEEAIDECSNRINLLLIKDKDEPQESLITDQHDAAPDKGEGNLLEPQNFEEEVLEKEDVVEEKPTVDIEVKILSKRGKGGKKKQQIEEHPRKDLQQAHGSKD
ncbi:protein FAR1-RELATED SEQUENCE 5-like [Chenopodium quinoa]|uniref:protein FAR1-RELATED SEQUENCE 5-like n=1 Tax=Chenopodium quinoa TaxID=63459 RepID=UPI000B77D653|nr:protein FAR1-RELATED SEQUENCE 5-like [Chenopodium quinoa]